MTFNGVKITNFFITCVLSLRRVAMVVIHHNTYHDTIHTTPTAIVSSHDSEDIRSF